MIDAALIAAIAFGIGYGLGAVRQAQHNNSPARSGWAHTARGGRLDEGESPRATKKLFRSGVSASDGERGGVDAVEARSQDRRRSAPPRVGFVLEQQRERYAAILRGRNE